MEYYGVNDGPTKRRLRRLVRVFNPEILVLFEPIVENTTLTAQSSSLGFSSCLSNFESSGKVWIMNTQNCIVDFISSSNRYVMLVLVLVI